MLLTKEVDVDVSGGGTTAKRYEQKGYTIPKEFYDGKFHVKKGTKIKIKIDDLPLNSTIKIQYECDCCNKIVETSYVNYTNKIKRNNTDKTYCIHCAPRALNSGNKHYKFNSTLTEEERISMRLNSDYSNFHRLVLKRDNYTCRCCGYKNNSKRDLVVHHLYSYDINEDLRCEVTNGITLCKKCHKAFHAIYGNGNNTKEQFEEWSHRILDDLSFESKLLPTKVAYCLEDDEIIENIGNYCKQHRNIKPNYIYNSCNKKRGHVFGKHYLWYEEYSKMSKQDITEYLDWCKKKSKTGIAGRPVVCIDTNKVYFNLTQAVRATHPQSNVGTFSGRIRANKTIFGETWMYLDDYNGDVDKLERAGDGW